MNGEKRPIPVPEVTSATATNRAGTLTVSATDQGLPVEIHVDRRELRFGAESLAVEILRLSRAAAIEARARRRIELSEAGFSAELLDLLGLPTREAADAELAAGDSEQNDDVARSSWMRHV